MRAERCHGVDLDGRERGYRSGGGSAAERARGWFLQVAATATTGPLSASTKIFDLDTDAPSRRTIITEGIDLADMGIPFSRAITGGTEGDCARCAAWRRRPMWEPTPPGFLTRPSG